MKQVLNHKHAIILGVFAVIAVVVSYQLATQVFQRVTLNADENSYLFQAQNYLDGRISRPFPPNFYAFQHKMIIVKQEVGWLSRYPFGHPLFLAPGVLIGNPYLIVALAAGLSLLIIARTGTLLGGRRVGLIAGVLLLLSPFFYFYHGTLLSHSSGLLATSILFWMYVCWRQTGDLKYAILAGLAWGWFLNNRTYTALLIAIPFGLDALWTLYRNRTQACLIGVAGFAGAAFSGVLALLIYNKLSVGDFTLMTYLVYNPTENLGFGSRIYGRVDHTLERGLGTMWSNLQSLNIWLFGFKGSALLCAALALIGWKREWTRLCLAAVALVVVGYVYFWYAGPLNAGPSYYFEVLPFMIVSAAFGVDRLIQYIRIWPPLVAALLIAFFGIRLSIPKAEELQGMNAPRRAIMDVIEQLPDQTLLFISPHDHRAAFADGNDMIFNPRGLDSRVIVAHWMPHAHKAMVRYFDGYEPKRLLRTRQGELQVIPVPEPDEPFSVEFAASTMGWFTGGTVRDESMGGRQVRRATAREHNPGLIAFGRYNFVFPGAFRIEVELKTSDSDAEDLLKIDVAGDFARLILAEQSVGAGEGWRTVVVPAVADDFMMIEPRIWYSGTGTVSVVAVRIVEDAESMD